ncbi:MAG: TonB C-terminal domain-containing protein [bacterium]|nr:TonB C-terminal domain-containing protein [bacterium]
MKNSLFKISDCIFTRKREEFGGKSLFALVSIVTHIFLVYVLLNTTFSINEFNDKKETIKIVPISRLEILLPPIPKKHKKKKHSLLALKSEGASAKKSPRIPKTVIKPPALPTDKAIAATGAFKKTAPGKPAQTNRDMALFENPSLSLKAPPPSFDASHYLKPDVLNELYAQINSKKKRRRRVAEIEMDNSKQPHIFQNGLDANDIVDYGGDRFFDSNGFDITLWAQKVVAKMRTNWYISPYLYSGHGGEVGIAVTFERSGTLADVELKRRSSFQYMDQAALNTINMSSPFPRLPSQCPGDQLKAYFLFNYGRVKPGIVNPGITPPDKPGTPVPAKAHQKNPFIARLGLLKGKGFDSTTLPGWLSLGLDMRTNVFYRLLYKESAIASGIMQEGFNTIEIPTAQLFRGSGSHEFLLELKNEDSIVKEKIRLEIKCSSPQNSGLVKNEIVESGYGVAMFLENQLIVFHKKSIPYKRMRVSRADKALNERRAEMSGAPDPFDVTGEGQFAGASLDVLSLARLAYKAIKPKKKKEKKKIKLYQTLMASYLQKAPGHTGDDQPMEIAISLHNTLLN